MLFSSVQYSRSVMSDSLWPHEWQHSRPPCPSPTPRVHPNPCPLSQWCHPNISSSVIPFSSIFPSIRVFSNESALRIRWQNYWSFSFNISPSNEYPGLISFRMDWLDLLAVQGTLKSLLQHHSSKASILSAQLSSQSNCHIHTFHSLLLYSNSHNLLKIINLFYIHCLTWSHNPELFEGQIYFNDFQIVRVDIKCLLV